MHDPRGWALQQCVCISQLFSFTFFLTELTLGNAEIGEQCTAEELAVYMRVGSFVLAQTAQLGAAAQTPSAVGCPNPSFK